MYDEKVLVTNSNKKPIHQPPKNPTLYANENQKSRIAQFGV